MAYQVIVTHVDDDRTWDSIRDTDRQALYQVATYMAKDSDSAVAHTGRCVCNGLVFGEVVEGIKERLFTNMGFELEIKYIP